MQKYKKQKRVIITVLLVLITSIFVFTANPRPAYAFGLPSISFTFGDVPRAIAGIYDKIRSKAGAIAFQQAVRSVTYKLARETAVWIASGDRGRKPLLFTSPRKALGQIGDTIGGRFLENLSKGLPVNLCNPGNTRILKQISIGLDTSIFDDLKFGDPTDIKAQCAKPTVIACQDAVDAEKKCEGSIKGTTDADILCLKAQQAIAKCSEAGQEEALCLARRTEKGSKGCKLSDVKRNLERSLVLSKDDLKDVRTTFEAGKNEVSIFGILKADKKKKEEQERLATQIQQTRSETPAVPDPVTGEPKTSGEQVKKQSEIAQEQSAGISDYITGDLFIDTANVFITTLTKAYLQRLQKGFYPFRGGTGPDSEIADAILGSRGSTQALLASFQEFSPSRAININSPGVIDLFSDMSTCPPPQYQNQYNCLLNQGLQNAVQQELTVRQALAGGHIDSNLQFPQAHNPDVPVLSQANLKKLRFLRVIPIGWEIAAQRIAASSNPQLSFLQVVSCFEDKSAEDQYRNWYYTIFVPWYENNLVNPGQVVEPTPPITLDELRRLPSDCPRVDPNDPNSDNLLYHLVDPGWVLTLPEQFCRAQGFGGIPEHERSPSRQSVCVDLQSCVNKDSSGKCSAFGYCTREKSVWQLNGQQCEPQFASCRTFTGTGKTLSILTRDIDDEGCTSQNAGCEWYSTTQDSNQEPGNPADDWLAASRIYLTGEAQNCNQQDAGAREIIPLTTGVNLARNGDFDPILMGTNPGPADGGWDFHSQTLEQAYLINNDHAGNLQAIAPVAARQQIKIKPFTYYTISFDIRTYPEVSTSGQVKVISKTSGQQLRNISFPPYSVDQPDPLVISLSESGGEINADSFTRYAAAFYSRQVSQIEIELSGQSIYDNIQLEEISLTDGLSASQTVAANPSAGPTDLNRVVPGNITISSPATNFRSYLDNQKLVFANAQECTQEESTARKYNPAARGSSSRIARILPSDLCPASCDGLQEFLAMPTEMDRLDNPLSTAQRVSFIPGRAQSCNAAQVGCEEFTNLSIEGTAQERREYFAHIESCVLDTNPNIDTFYTWEGTDTAGFQLQTWQLLADGAGGPCANYPQGAGLNPNTGSCQGLSQVCDPLAGDPNCRVFINEDGEEKPRDVTRLVTASSQCAGFRRTSGQQPWYFIPNEANKCSAQAVDCREYKGQGANLTQRIFLSAFEGGNTDNWTKSPATEILSGASVVAGQASAVIGAGEVMSRPMSLALAGLPFDPTGGSSRSLNLRFLAKCAASNCSISDINIISSDGTTTKTVSLNESPLSITGDWRFYEVGPALVSRLLNVDETITLRNASAGSLYIDNIELLLNQDRLFFISKSTQSVASGGAQPDECKTTGLNRCQSYTDEGNNRYYIARFDKLFNEASLDCRAVIDTQNSNSPYSQTFNFDADFDNPIDNYTVPGDEFMYRYIKKGNIRQANAAGCAATGLPDDRNAPTGWQTTYKRIDSDTFGATLCRAEGLGCKEFTASGGGAYVFRDPQNKLCAWDAVRNAFVRDNPGGNPIICTPGSGWVSQCPSAQASCTAYRQTNPALGGNNFFQRITNPGFVEPDANAYYLSNTVTAGSCSGGEEVESGCVNFEIDPDNIDKLIASPSPQSVLEVQTTRECAEWLTPTTSSEFNDAKSRTQRTVSYDLGRCQKLDDSGQCVNWVGCSKLDLAGNCSAVTKNFPNAYWQDDAGTPFDAPGANRFVGYLTDKGYIDRLISGQTMFDTGWDYSGYSLPGEPPIEFIKELKDVSGNYYLAHQPPGYNEQSAADTNIDLSCRVYPEEDSPFSGAGVFDASGQAHFDTGNQQLENLNLCRDGVRCQCAYKKVTSTEQGNLYYAADTDKSFPEDTRSITNQDGWRGYCLEYDEETRDPNSSPECLVWLPIDAVKAAPNMFDNHPDAGYTSSAPLYYCLNAANNKLGSPPERGLEYVSAQNNDYLAMLKYTDFGNNFTPTKITLTGSGNLTALLRGGNQNNASGLFRFDVRSVSRLASLHEYDIEAIILKVSDRPAADWPPGNQEFLLTREGFASSPSSSPTATDRWTALWCGGDTDSPNCDFNGVYSWDKFLPFISDNDRCDNRGHDPIDSDNPGHTNAFAVRAVFAGPNDPNPYKFLGFEGGTCDNTAGDGWVELNVIFQLREYCTDVAQVHANDVNKAWTGRINQKSLTSFPGVYSSVSNSFENKLTYKFSQDNAPFGAIVPPPNTVHKPEDWDSRKDENVVDNPDGSQSVKTLEPGNQPLYVEKARKQVRAGSPYSCQNILDGVIGRCLIPPQKDGVTPATQISEAFGYLKQIFVKIYKRWIWRGDRPGGPGYELQTAGNPDDSSTTGRCPTIQATSGSSNNFLPVKSGAILDIRQLNADDAYNSSTDHNCRGGRFSVFGAPVEYNGAKDLPSNKKQHTVFVGEQVPLQFYAYNKNGEQMPLKKIIIDWGDGVDTELVGSFRNHKPSEADYAAAGITQALESITCNSRSANYGDTAKACQTGVFEFKHVYQQPGNYIPKLTIVDNWGLATESNYTSANPAPGAIIEVLPRIPPEAAPEIRTDFTERFSNQTANITWGNILAATIYDVFVSDAPLDQVTSPGYALTGQLGAVPVKVRACNVAGCGPFSNELTITFIIPRPDAVNISSNKFVFSTIDTTTITWRGAQYVQQAYQVYKKPDILGADWVSLGAVSLRSDETYSFSFGLGSGQWDVKVAACNSSGCTDSNLLRFTAVTPVVSVPGNLTSDKTSYNLGETARFAWDSVSQATAYKVYVNDVLRQDSNGRVYDFTPVTGGNYTIKVRGYNIISAGPSAERAVAFTVPTPGIPTISSITPTDPAPGQNAVVAWGSVAHASYYIVTVSGDSPARVNSGASYSFTSPTVATKTVTVKACNSLDICSTNSSPWTVDFAVPTPGIPTGITFNPASPVAGASFTVSWTPADDFAEYYLISGVGSVVTVNHPNQSYIFTNPATSPGTVTATIKACNAAPTPCSAPATANVTFTLGAPTVAVSPSSSIELRSLDEFNHDSTMVGYWPLDGNALDKSGNNRNGTIVGGVTAASGKVNDAMSFDGGNDSYINLGVMPLNGLTKGSISLWFNASSFTNGNFDVIANTGIPSASFGFYTADATGNGGSGNGTAPVLKFVVSTSRGGGPISMGTVAPNTWYNAVLIYDGSTVKGYLNNVLKNTDTGYTNQTLLLTGANNSNSYIGSGNYGLMSHTPPNGNFSWNGKIDEIRYYNRALLADEVANYYDATAGAFATLSWPAVSSAQTYRIFQTDASGAIADPNTPLLTTANLQYIDTPPTSAATKYFVVKACANGVCGPSSTPVTAVNYTVVIPDSLININVDTTNPAIGPAGGATITWKDPGNAKYYKVRVRDDSSGTPQYSYKLAYSTTYKLTRNTAGQVYVSVAACSQSACDSYQPSPPFTLDFH